MNVLRPPEKLPPRPDELPPRTGRAPLSPAAIRSQRAALLVGVLLALWSALDLFAAILLPFVMAALIAYFLDPPATRLARLGMPRPAAALLLIVGLIAVGFLFVLLLYPLILAQLGLLLGRVPQYATQFQTWAREVIAHLQERLGSDFVDDKLRDLVGGQAASVLTFLVSTTTRLIGGGFALFNVLTLVVVTPVVAFYLLRDWQAVMRRMDGWLPRRYEGVLRAQAREVDRILSAWIRGQALCCVLLALYYALALSFVGLDFGLIVGLAAGLLSFIPYVGSITAAFLSLGLAFAQFPDWRGVIEVIAVLVMGQILEGYVIYPRFLGDRVELPAVWVIFALFAGGAAFGFLGVMLAVPVAATIGVLCRFWLRRYLASPLYLEPPDRDAEAP
jgi:predicted PurR-regulated permease PerM